MNFWRRLQLNKKGRDEKYYPLFEYASDAIMVLEFTGLILDVNENMCRLLQYTRDELLSKNLTQLLDPDELNQFPLRFRELFEGRELLAERKMIKKDGNIAFVEASVKKIDNSRIITIIRDITYLRTVQKQIAVSESLFRSAFEHSAIGMGLVSIEGNWIKVNRQLCRIVGYNEEEMMRCRFQDITHPDDLEADLTLLRQTLDGKINVYRIEKRYIHKDGSVVWINLTASLIRDERNVPMYFVSQVEDVTEKKKISEQLMESENKFRTLVEQSLVGVYIIKNGVFSYVSPRYAEIFGYTQEEMTNSFPAETAAYPEDRHLYYEYTEDRLSGRVDYVHYEARGMKKGGEPFWVEVFGSRTYYEGGLAIIGTLLDISERKRQEESMRELASHLQDIREEERYKMSREIHDELGQQLTALKLEVSALRFKLTDDVARQKAGEIIDLISTTINTVRKIATDLRPYVLDDLGLVAALQWQTREFEKRSGIKSAFTSNVIDIDVEPKNGLAIFRIYQESLTNIMRHAHAGHVSAILKEEEDSLQLIVEDDGDGFDPTLLKTTKSLGLVGIKERALVMNGHFEITTAPGKGTTLSLSIPLSKIVHP
ncbi:PAS domain-containing sensor histidine kinase [Dinghuibacter silviterrae]|uniref:PAS domain S-box-containing protein n=1 Tax=Dinghuibacter silviterrae TaxID=1539049 RepID=A0A4R8DG23_9BACT|nr:PAS domain-containing sensor histidine kinase [Dinghuibacter silviterrae]TDW95910.1 PAS domain S-box-containing protein [Dinghuibacter silviterrae]